MKWKYLHLKFIISLQPPQQASSYPIGLTEFFETKNPNTLSPKDPPDTNPLTVPLAYVSMRRVLCVAFLATSRLLSELHKQFRLLRVDFPPQYLNYSPQNLVSNFSFNNFTISEANLSIATYQYVITTKLEVLFESMDKI